MASSWRRKEAGLGLSYYWRMIWRGHGLTRGGASSGHGLSERSLFLFVPESETLFNHCFNHKISHRGNSSNSCDTVVSVPFLSLTSLSLSGLYNSSS